MSVANLNQKYDYQALFNFRRTDYYFIISDD